MTPTDSQLDATFIALADPTRRAILARLMTGEASVNELAEPFAISQPAISKHLKILERAGLVSRSAAGTRRPVKIEAAPDEGRRRLAREVSEVLGDQLPAASMPCSRSCRRRSTPRTSPAKKKDDNNA